MPYTLHNSGVEVAYLVGMPVSRMVWHLPIMKGNLVQTDSSEWCSRSQSICGRLPSAIYTLKDLHTPPDVHYRSEVVNSVPLISSSVISYLCSVQNWMARQLYQEFNIYVSRILSL